MRAVATALVLIIGAAVVLWYGNTLNSWVLGGLIGGLAALLLSIPISLTLFSYFSRRHDDQLKAEVEEELERAQVYGSPPPLVPNRAVRGAYEVESYLEDEAEFEEEEAYERDYRVRPARNLPVPAHQRLPMVNESSRKLQASPSAQAVQRAGNPVSRKQQYEEAPTARGKDSTTRRPTSRQINYPGHPGFEPGSQGPQSPQNSRVYQSQQSLHRSAALRAARREMAQQNDDAEVMPTTPARRQPSARPSQQLPAQGPDSISLRTNRQMPQARPPLPNQYRPRRTIDSTPSRNALPMPGETTAREPQGREPRTDYLNNQHHPQTAPIRPQAAQPPRTGQIARNPQVEQQPRNPDVITGSLNTPMVRRAPYLYDDDPLLQELEQQIDTPTVRRSSRRESRD